MHAARRAADHPSGWPEWPSQRGDGGSSSSALADGGASGGGQLVTADGQHVLALAGHGDAATALGDLADQTVTGTGVQVLSVPADEGFWVGTSGEQRVWVQLRSLTTPPSPNRSAWPRSTVPPS